MRGMATITAAVLLTACGSSGNGNGEAPELDVSASWEGDTISVEADTNLPDGAVLTWSAFDEPEGEDGADVRGDDLTVTDGTATGTVDVAGFDDDAELEVAFVPSYQAQPEEVTDGYDPNEGATETVTVAR